MTMTITQATALNTFLRYAIGSTDHATDPVAPYEAEAALATLLAGADKVLGAGYHPNQAPALVALIPTHPTPKARRTVAHDTDRDRPCRKTDAHDQHGWKGTTDTGQRINLRCPGLTVADAQRGPSPEAVQSAMAQLKEELEHPAMAAAISRVMNDDERMDYLAQHDDQRDYAEEAANRADAEDEHRSESDTPSPRYVTQSRAKLRILAKDRGLMVSGTREELAARLTAADEGSQ